MMFRCNTTSCIGDAESDTVCSLVIFYLATIQKDTSLRGVLNSVGKHFIDGLQGAVTVGLYSIGVLLLPFRIVRLRWSLLSSNTE